MPVAARGRDGRILGGKALATRERFLDAVGQVLAATGWRHVSVVEVARTAGMSPPAFYQLWDELEPAVVALGRRTLDRGEVLPKRLERVLRLLADEGWIGARTVLAKAAQSAESRAGVAA